VPGGQWPRLMVYGWDGRCCDLCGCSGLSSYECGWCSVCGLVCRLKVKVARQIVKVAF